MAHRASQIFEESLFDGDENAIVDFKYSNNEKLTWWFDHHQSAFLTPEDARHFQTHPSPKKMFDPSFKSCTNYIRTKAEEKWGFTAPDLDELVHWANIIDGAQYADPRTAVELGAPAMKLTLVIEGSKGSDTVQRIIGYMQRMPLEEIVHLPEIQAIYKPLYERHLKSLQIIREKADETGGVITFDLTGYDLEGYNKFIPYYIYPHGVYTVAVSPSSFRTKISVGSNPWSPVEPTHNLASICERYGGGGHARVGAISLEPGQVSEARRIAAEVAAELRS
ncbi:MAG: phosphoesterase [Acidobacteriota bacterium]